MPLAFTLMNISDTIAVGTSIGVIHSSYPANMRGWESLPLPQFSEAYLLPWRQTWTKYLKCFWSKTCGGKKPLHTKQSKASHCESALSHDTVLSFLCTGTQGRQTLFALISYILFCSWILCCWCWIQTGLHSDLWSHLGCTVCSITLNPKFWPF